MKLWRITKRMNLKVENTMNGNSKTNTGSKSMLNLQKKGKQKMKISLKKEKNGKQLHHRREEKIAIDDISYNILISMRFYNKSIQ